MIKKIVCILLLLFLFYLCSTVLFFNVKIYHLMNELSVDASSYAMDNQEFKEGNIKQYRVTAEKCIRENKFIASFEQWYRLMVLSSDWRHYEDFRRIFLRVSRFYCKEPHHGSLTMNELTTMIAYLRLIQGTYLKKEFMWYYTIVWLIVLGVMIDSCACWLYRRLSR